MQKRWIALLVPVLTCTCLYLLGFSGSEIDSVTATAWSRLLSVQSLFTTGYHSANLTTFPEWTIYELESRAVTRNKGKNIFFIETKDARLAFPPKLLCAFESAARHNPDHEVFVVLSHKSGIRNVPRFMTSAAEVTFVKVNFDLLFGESPLSLLWTTGEVRRSKFALNNISNSLRLVLLELFGGVYFDSDVVALASLPERPENFLVAYGEDDVNNAVLRFSKGHKFLGRALRRMARNFKGNIWGNQGPSLVTAIMRETCTLLPVINESPIRRNCTDFAILPRQTAYPVRFEDWWKLYYRNERETVRALLANSFALHFWSAMDVLSDDRKRKIDPELPFYEIFARNCPMTERLELRPRIGENL